MSKNGFDVIPPHNLHAEKAVLGALALCDDYQLILPTLKRLKPEHFYEESHQKVFQAMSAMVESHLPIDIVTLAHVLRTKGWDREVGQGRLIDILEHTPHALHMEYYAEIVIEHFSRRRMIDTADYLLKQSTNMTSDVSETWKAIGLEAGKHRKDAN